MSNIKYEVEYYDKEKTKKRYESWCLNGEYHRKNGPAVIRYYKNGQVEFELWYLNGEELSRERIKQLKLEIEADKCIEEMLNE